VNKTVLTQEQLDKLLGKIDSGQAWFMPSNEGLSYEEASTREWTITLSAKTATELLDNPPEATETLKEMLRSG